MAREKQTVRVRFDTSDVVATRPASGNDVAHSSVAETLKQVEARQRWKALTPAQRKRAALDAKRIRTTLELNPLIAEMLQLVAEAEGISPASVVNWFGEYCLRRYGGELVLEADQVLPSRGRYFFQYLSGDLAALKATLEARISGQGENGEKLGGKDLE